MFCQIDIIFLIFFWTIDFFRSKVYSQFVNINEFVTRRENLLVNNKIVGLSNIKYFIIFLFSEYFQISMIRDIRGRRRKLRVEIAVPAAENRYCQT